MGEMSWKQIKDSVRADLWPFPTEAKTQVGVHNKYLLEGAMDMQKWVPCLQSKNTTQFPFCSTFFQCGKTVVDVPNFGLIRRIYTIANGKWCDPCPYRSTNFAKIECWSRALLTFTEPLNVGLKALPMGFKYAEASSNNDCAAGRARSGLWAIYRHRLYVAPWLQSNETLIVEWDGMKPDWQDTDMVDDTLWTPRVIACLRAYVWWQHLNRFGDDINEKGLARAAYESALGDLIHDCREATQQQNDAQCNASEQPALTQDELDDDKVSTEEVPYVMAAVGDYGNSSSGDDAAPDSDDADAASSATSRDAVAALIQSWAPSKFIGIGDMWYGTSLELSDLIDRTPSYYQQLNQDGNFIPVIGNHDRDPVGRLDVIKGYFKFPSRPAVTGDVPNANYFSVLVDPRVEVFVLDAGYDSAQVNQELDGSTETSKMAQWLRTALARSTANWKLVFVHQDPFTSFRTTAIAPTLSGDGFQGYPELRWPYKSWGADAVFNGHIHSYERLEKDGFPYLVVGSGGRVFVTFDEAHVSHYSKVRFAGYGAEKITVTCKKLTLEFFSDDGVLKDSLELTK